MAFRVKQIEKILSDSGMPLENINKCAEDLCKRHAIDLDEIKAKSDKCIISFSDFVTRYKKKIEDSICL